MIKVEDRVGLRIDLYLSEILESSRSKIQKLVKDGKVIVNGKVVSSSYSVRMDDEIIVDDKLAFKISNGVKLYNKWQISDKVIFKDRHNRLLAIYKCDSSDLITWKGFFDKQR